MPNISRFIRDDRWLSHTVKQPDFFERGVSGPYSVKDNQHVVCWRISNFACEAFHLRRLIRVRGVTARVYISAFADVSRFHLTSGPQVTSALKIFPASDGVPVAR